MCSPSIIAVSTTADTLNEALRRFDLDQCANGDLVVGIMGRACMRGCGILLVQLGPPSWWSFFFDGRAYATNRCLRKKMEELEGKRQNVMAVTDFLALFWQFQHNQKKGDAMKKIIWALAFAITTGMALTTAFGFDLLPLHLF